MEEKTRRKARVRRNDYIYLRVYTHTHIHQRWCYENTNEIHAREKNSACLELLTIEGYEVRSVVWALFRQPC